VSGTASHRSLAHNMDGNVVGVNTMANPQATILSKALHTITTNGAQIKPSSHIVKPEGSVEDTKARDKLEILEERVREFEGVRNYGLSNAAGLCLALDVVGKWQLMLMMIEC